MGEITVSGGKNTAVAVIPAALLCDEPCTVENLPDIDDVHALIEILNLLGAKTEYIPGKHLIGAVARFLDKHGWMPQSIIATDPYYCSVVLTNLGSLKLDAGYHHMTNWGTNSVFCAIGLIKKRPYYDETGAVTMRQSVNLSLTIDERIADGYYYAKTIRLLQHLLENPELLELPMGEKVEF